MELPKKKILAVVAVVATAVLGAVSLDKCPWIKKHWDTNVVPLLREAAPADTAPVTTE
jgi:hypothetical protein